MLLLVHIAKRFISNAGVRAKRVDKNPYWIEKEIVAAIVHHALALEGGHG